jgi:hypothetical protein
VKDALRKTTQKSFRVTISLSKFKIQSPDFWDKLIAQRGNLLTERNQKFLAIGVASDVVGE